MKKLNRLFLLLIVVMLGSPMEVNARETGNQNSDEESVVEATTDQVIYSIYVNRELNCVTVMQENSDGELIPVKAMVCSCGRAGHLTPLGTFRTSDYYEWRLLVDDSYGRYAVRFNNRILFHSVPYIAPEASALEWDQYNLLGEGASLGCVRLSVADAKWIYDNCPPGTQVVVYDDPNSPGPLGKPEAEEIDANSPYRGWDPTDMSANNPWLIERQISDEYAAFNADMYAERYPDVEEAFGHEKYLLWLHYLNFGINEGRIATFDME